MASDFKKFWNGLSAKVDAEILRLIKSGVPADKATLRAFKKFDVDKRFEAFVLEDVSKAYQAGVGITFSTSAKIADFENWWSSKIWFEDGLSLSRRIQKQGMQKRVAQEIKRSIDALESWQKTARNINNAKLLKGDVAGHMWDTIKAGRRALAGDQRSIKEFERAARVSQRQIERLALDGAPNKRLKAAYQSVIDSVENRSAKALERSVARSINEKALYNAERIARTERAKAFDEAFAVKMDQDSDVIGWRSVLSSRHPRPDICDVHAEADFYGMGAGVYPTSRGPRIPHHPNCICNHVLVYEGKKGLAKNYDHDAGKRYLSRQSSSRKKSILGARGADNFKRNGKGWSRNIAQWNGHQSTKPKVPKKFRQP